MMTRKHECVNSHMLYSEILMELLKSCKKCKEVILMEKSDLFSSVSRLILLKITKTE